MRHLKVCEWCHREFTASRSDARFCSNACRQAHWKAGLTRVYVMPPENPRITEGRPATEREIVGTVATVRQCAASLTAAELTGPERYRPLCGRLGRGILGVLEVEGL